MTKRIHAEQARESRRRHREYKVAIVKQPRAAGFTLIELLIVVIILSTLASIVVPSFFNKSEESKTVVAITTVKNIQKKIQANYLLNDQWPAEIDRAWFVNKKYPRSPFAPDFEGPSTNVVSTTEHEHPRVKTPEEEGHPPFWYSSGNGSFRIRVPAQATDQQTITLYNIANDSDVVSIHGRVDGQ